MPRLIEHAAVGEEATLKEFLRGAMQFPMRDLDRREHWRECLNNRNGKASRSNTNQMSREDAAPGDAADPTHPAEQFAVTEKAGDAKVEKGSSESTTGEGKGDATRILH